MAHAALEGKQHQPRDIARECYNQGWVNVANLTIAVAVCRAESQGFDGAWHDNVKLLTDLTDGQVVANVETTEHFTVVDANKGTMRSSTGDVSDYPLTTEWITSRDVGAFQINIPASAIGTPQEFDLYDWVTNVKTARDKWNTWSNNGKDAVQGWNHWAAYSSGIALDPEAKGKYIQQACRGVGNFLADYLFHIPNPPMLYYVGGSKTPV